MRTHPIVLFAVGLFRLLTGRFCFPREAVGQIFVMEDGRDFRVFRRATRRSHRLSPAGAAFVVRFKPLGMTVEQNIRFSRFPMILMFGFPGFRAKFWTVQDSTGLCQGIYEWDAVADAERYASSIAVRFMTGRSEPGSVNYRLIDHAKSDCPPTRGPQASGASLCFGPGLPTEPETHGRCSSGVTMKEVEAACPSQ